MSDRSHPIPRTVGALIDLLHTYPSETLLADYCIERCTGNSAITEYIASWDSFDEEGEANPGKSR